MTEIISVENLSKAFAVGKKVERAETLVGEVAAWFKAPLENLRSLKSLNTSKVDIGNNEQGIYWALRDVCFSVNSGDVVGVVGKNGAGKSTLLKILSRIAAPTSGKATIRGRICSLLEVGTGFHPELSGRENIYMNGTILGMRKFEIDEKFDEIVEFAGVQRFLDTPTKRYSSGMQVRLAFAVAAHLEPEILVIDEVLAVGDAEFQRRCLGKMEDVAKSGRTVLFVSHNMAAVQNLCTRGVLLQDGNLVADGPINEIVKSYMDAFECESYSRDLSSPTLQRSGTKEARLTHISVGAANSEGAAIPMGSDLRITVGVTTDKNIDRVAIGIMILDALGTRVCGLHSGDTAKASFELTPGKTNWIEVVASRANLMPGNYRVTVYVQNFDSGEIIDHITQAVSFDIVSANIYQTGSVPRGNPVMYLPVSWKEVGVG
jgi:lipopolysaccharide transport system ATP-binding protein